MSFAILSNFNDVVKIGINYNIIEYINLSTLSIVFIMLKILMIYKYSLTRKDMKNLYNKINYIFLINDFFHKNYPKSFMNDCIYFILFPQF